MSRVDEKIANAGSKPYYSFEFFPPKTDEGMANLADRLDRMTSLEPSWVSITWGAGGSTHDKSLQLAETAHETGYSTCLHLTCTNMEVSKLDNALERAKQIGIRNILALRGDPPRGKEYSFSEDSEFKYAIDLVKYIRKNHGDYFCIGVAGYPEGQTSTQGMNGDTKVDNVKVLKEKVDAGASFVVTQLFYDVDVYIPWLKQCREEGINVPILAGIMPIQSYTNFRRMTNLCKATVPKRLWEVLEPIKADDQAVRDFGVDYAIAMIKTLIDNGVSGFHLCTLNLEKSVTRIIESLGWISPESPEHKQVAEMDVSHNTLIARSDNHHAPHRVINGHENPSDELEIGASQAFHKAIASVLNQERHAVGHRPTTGPAWDEFPNGRFGDARSPAYGEIDGWGVSLKIAPQQALDLWGYPTTLSDISKVFVDYLNGTIDSNPWSEEPVLEETKDVLPELIHLNADKHWWTVGSQPTVDGAPSSHPTYGFGPPEGGNIYQKSFVEFFASRQDIEAIEKALEEKPDLPVTFYASNRKGDFKTNVPSDGANAVTWGVFIGKEIVTTTLIEEVSFKAWKDEAFEIWNEWKLLFPISSPSRRLLNEILEDRWLISIVHHDFKNPRGLWDFLEPFGANNAVGR